MEPRTANAIDRVRGLADGLLRWLMVTAAFVLGCQELYDADVWWHVRAGQWIWSNGRVPNLDPFTFTADDRPWIDLHWLFQLLMAAAYAIGRVPGIILTASGVCAAVMLAGFTARDRRWPMWVVAACWLPALLTISGRMTPRPELLSLLGLAAFLAVLFRVDKSPLWAWMLVPLQVLWVNAHALFVLGPFVLAAYLIDHAAHSIGRRRPRRAPRPAISAVTRAEHEESGETPDPQRRPPVGEAATQHTHQAFGETPDPHNCWWHLGGAAVAVGVACLVNPYGLRGALFPLELFPKITTWGGVYKAHIQEFMDLRAFVRGAPQSAGGNVYLRAECFLLWVLPLSFLLPAIWRLHRSCLSSANATKRPVRALVWGGAFALVAGLLLLAVLGFPAVDTPEWLVRLNRLAPVALLFFGVCGAVLFIAAKSPRQVALLAAVAGAAEAAWVAWFQAHLFGPDPGPAQSSLTALLAIAAAILSVRAGGRSRLFRLFLSVAFGYLALQAVRNINLFGLVAGFVLAWNLGEWAAELAADIGAARPWNVAGLAVPVALIGLVGLGISGIVTDRFSRFTGNQQQFGAREMPLAYPHEAARFARRPGLPQRALALDLRQAGVYVFHNGPERKVFMDSRLEVPSRSTFETFLRLRAVLNEGRPGWAEPLRRMGAPLILVDHEDDSGAEATLMADPAWRCIYYDPVASLFVSRRRGELESAFPDVDFAARHFGTHGRPILAAPYAIAEAKGLLNLGSSLQRRPGSAADWPRRFSLMLLAGDRLRSAISTAAGAGAGDRSSKNDAARWVLLGHCYWNMTPDLSTPPTGPDQPWDLARGLFLAQATYCYRRALEVDHRETAALIALHDSYKARRMADAQQSVTAQLRQSRPLVGAASTPATQRDGRSPPVADALPTVGENRDELSRVIDSLLKHGRPEAAVRLYQDAERRGIAPPWEVRDTIAVALLHLGHPNEARRIWERALDSPSRAIGLLRLATASLSALDLPAAERDYRAALDLDPSLAEAWLGLTLLYTERGEAMLTLTAARECQRRSATLTPAERSLIASIEALAARYVPLR
jgi:pentatricopeptide repeat protein